MINKVNIKKISLLLALILTSCSTIPKNDSNDKNKPRVPTIKNAEVKTIWIPDKIEGNKFEEGHYVHIIDKQATWGKE
jgi:starvation-inducible outer membrane lipoprotein